MMTEEAKRLQEARKGRLAWRKWGPYLSERQWGTVREDYSANGDAWSYFSHDQARSRAYRWGEDGIAGISDAHQVLCFALAFWNTHDPILKERLFGLTNSEGNHGEDVKEYYYYLDNTPTHSYMKYLYKYPQAAYPYAELVKKNRQRMRTDLEYELVDTGIFAPGYFDLFIEYAKVSPTDILIQITIHNRGSNKVPLHILPTLWFRNTWVWNKGGSKPILQKIAAQGYSAIQAHHTDPMFQESLEDFVLFCDGQPPCLFTDNESNNQRLFGTMNAGPYVKDGIGRYVIGGETTAVHPLHGTKASAYYVLSFDPQETKTIRLRLTSDFQAIIQNPFANFEAMFEQRREEANAFFASITPSHVSSEEAMIMRQALSGMLWSKQYYYFDADLWLEEHHAHPLHAHSHPYRNREWFHMVNNDIISMPDKWEYPWYAAWDLSFHAIAFSGVDLDFAKDQLELMFRALYMHPSGQVPAYEWNFSDVNPPVQAWATIFLAKLERSRTGKSDFAFLKRVFSKLMLNFTWWVNRKDRFGKNVFEGGFLGLDNIGVFDRSSPLPTGGYLEQADATAWMALFCQNMMEISIELVEDDPAYEDICLKFCEHFLFIAAAMNRVGEEGMWDEQDGFYYDLLRKPDGSSTRLKVRSMVGLFPLCATTVIEPWQREKVPNVVKQLQERVKHMPELQQSIHATGPGHRGYNDRGIFALVNQERLRRILSRMFDEEEFLSPFGLRSLSKYHEKHPYSFRVGDNTFCVSYLPAESDTGMFGGNSNWRGPIWFPVNLLMIRALLHYYLYYGDTFQIEFPTHSGKYMNLFQVAKELSKRLSKLFLNDAQGRRPAFGESPLFQKDPHWHDCLLFYEYFHGDNGAGIGASHQTGWTGTIGFLVQFFGALDEKTFLEGGTKVGFPGMLEGDREGTNEPRSG